MITNVNVTGLEHALRCAQFPMAVDLNKIKGGIKPIHKTLGSWKPGHGDDTFLKGIRVELDLRAPEYFWTQFSTYDFWERISSQSKMHKLTKFPMEDMCNEFVPDDVLAIFEKYRNEYLLSEPGVMREEAFQRMMSVCPMGFERTVGVNLSYLQLKTMYLQRRGHRLIEWQEFCDWIETLPHFKELVLGG